jgi:hypothetical protein
MSRPSFLFSSIFVGELPTSLHPTNLSFLTRLWGHLRREWAERSGSIVPLTAGVTVYPFALGMCRSESVPPARGVSSVPGPLWTW